MVAGRWTLKDVAQGKPLNHPSHPMFVHFPSALLPAAAVFDVVSFIHPDVTVARAAAYNVMFGLAMAGGAAFTGLVDYLPMIGGSRKKRVGTYHLICQLTAVSAFAISLLFRVLDYDADQTPVVAFAFALVGVAALVVGNYWGGHLVYRQGMRVSTEL